MGKKLLFVLFLIPTAGLAGKDDQWLVYPTTIFDRQTWISFNKSFADSAKQDKHRYLSTFRVTFKKPTQHGLSSNEEFPQLLKLDKGLSKLVEETNKGVYVGRVTAAGTRTFFFYTNLTRKEIDTIKSKIEKTYAYTTLIKHKEDKTKQAYWGILYPREADWQIISDLRVLEALRKQGDNENKAREVRHWAYFKTREKLDEFIKWLKKRKYKILQSKKLPDKSVYQIVYSHMGTMRLTDISSHSIASQRECSRLGGDYDGWETSVEK